MFVDTVSRPSWVGDDDLRNFRNPLKEMEGTKQKDGMPMHRLGDLHLDSIG